MIKIHLSNDRFEKLENIWRLLCPFRDDSPTTEATLEVLTYFIEHGPGLLRDSEILDHLRDAGIDNSTAFEEGMSEFLQSNFSRVYDLLYEEEDNDDE